MDSRRDARTVRIAMNRWLATSIFSLLFAGVIFFLGIGWGLPTRQYDSYLFGDRPVWTGQQIMQLGGDRVPGSGLGADVDRDPICPADLAAGEYLLNRDDAQRAEIVRRYRLYSAQPDEMITFMSLAGMRPGRLELDPGLYQYGGLWVYPVGALLRTAAAARLVELRADPAYYLDHPEEFGRFYVVARSYSAAWGVLGAAAVFWVVRRCTQSVPVTALATCTFALLPVVTNMSHEAKPHLAGAALMLWACVAAAMYAAGGPRLWWVASAGLCGGATGMILSSWPIVLVIPVMLVLRRNLPIGQRVVILLAGAIIALDVYFATNPYVLKHLLSWHAPANPLRSNLANSAAMYRPQFSVAGMGEAALLLGYAATPPVILLGLVGAVVLLRPSRAASGDPALQRALVLLLAAPALAILAQFALVAAGKPGEHARFAMFPAVVLLLLAVAGTWRLGRGGWLAWIGLLLIAVRVGVGGASYLWHFVDDASGSTRLAAAERLRERMPAVGGTLAVSAEPAPYACPPVDLFRHQIVLVPRGAPTPPPHADVCLFPVDDPTPLIGRVGADAVILSPPRILPTPISWARKPWLVRFSTRADHIPPGPGSDAVDQADPTATTREAASRPAGD